MRSGSRIPAGFVAALVLLAMQWRFLLGDAGPVGDASIFHLPYQMLVGDFARNGELLQWNPWTNGGSPDGAEPQVGAFSPIALLCGLIGGGTPWSFLLLWLGTWALTAVGMAALVRHLGAPRWAQIGLALAWASNGVFTGHAMHTCFMHAFALLPWSVRALDRALLATDGRRAVHAVAAGAWWGLSALAGYPGAVMVAGLVLGGWALVRTLFADRGAVTAEGHTSTPCTLRTALLQLIVLGATALPILAPTYVAFFIEGQGFTGRTSGLPRAWATGWQAVRPREANPLEPRGLWTIAHPGIAARATSDAPDLFAYTDLSSVDLDTGLAAWILLAMAFAGGRRSPFRFALLVLALLFLGTAMGHTLPLRAWLYDLVPPTRFFRHAAIFRAGFLFAVTALAALGARDLAARPLARAAIGVAIVGAVLSASAHFALGLSPRGVDVAWWIVVHGSALATGIAAHRGRLERARIGLVVVLAIGVIASLRLHAPLVERDSSRLTELAATQRSNLDLGAAGFARQLCAPTIPAWKQEAIVNGQRDRVADDIASPVSRLFDDANLPPKVPILFGYAAFNNGFLFSMTGTPALLEIALTRDRVFIADDAVHLPRGDAEFALLTEAAKSGAVPLVVHDDGPPSTDAAAVARRAQLRHVSFTVESYTPRQLRLRVEPQPKDCYLLVTDRWGSGWRATVDDRPAAVLPALFLWRTVRLPAGATSVQFDFRLAGYPWLQLLSAATMLAAVVASLRHRKRAANG